MSLRDSEFDRLLSEWLEDDAFAAPASPVEAAIEFARSHPRRSDWLAFLRRDAMTSRATTGLRPVAVFATVAVVLLIGAGSLALIGGGPEPTATPTATPTAGATATASTPPTSPSVTPVAVRPLPRTGSVAAGTYRVEFPDSPVTIDLTLEDRWTAGSSFTEQGAPEPWNVQYLLDAGDFSHTIWFYTVGNVNTDGCDWEGTQPDPPIGPTVDDFVAALDAQQNTDLSNPVDVVLDGYAGMRVDMRVSERGECRPGEGRPPLVMWVRPNGQPGPPLVFDPLAPSFITVWILDVDGHRVVIDTYLNPAFKAELREPEQAEARAQAEAEVLAVMNSMKFAVD